jgi:hypothetical protein
VLSRLKLLKRLQEVDLRPDEAWALVDRVGYPRKAGHFISSIT